MNTCGETNQGTADHGRFLDKKPLCSCKDEILVERTKAGDAEAYGELVRRYWRLAAAAGFVQLGNQDRSEETAQQGFVTAYERLHQLRRPERFASWLLRIIARDGKRVLRRNKHQPVNFSRWARATDQAGQDCVADLPAPLDADPGKRVLRAEEKLKVWEAVQSLKARDRVLVLLRYFEGLPFRSISEKTGCSEGALRVRLHRIMARMKSGLRGYFKEEG